MWPSKLLLIGIVVGVLQIHQSCGQLRNQTLWEQGIDDLDYYDPAFYGGNITRIVGGKPIYISQVPWQVALYRRGTFVCGGSIISVDWVLTAAHCVKAGGRFTVRAGSSYVKRGGQVRSVRVAVFNSEFSLNTLNKDIAMIRVKKRFSINKYAAPIALAKEGRCLPPRYFISGWGTLSEKGSRPDRLRGVTIRRVDRSQCKQKYLRADTSITKYMICADMAGRDACQGDSGGPLVVGRIQYGIVSFGIGCARKNYPGVYTNIGRLNGWIRVVVKRRGGKMPEFK